MKRTRVTFLRDIFYLSLSCFGGPQAHLTHFQKRLVEKGQWVSDDYLTEMNALCQLLPGPTSTQILLAVAHKIGGANLAYFTLLIWILPSVLLMTAAGILITTFEMHHLSLGFMRFVQPIAVGFVAYAAYTISLKQVRSTPAIVAMIIAGVATFFIQSPVLFPVLLFLGGTFTAIKYKELPKEKIRPYSLAWSNLFLWAGVLITAAALGGLTKNIPALLPIRLFENFYRDGSLIFGGGQTLVPILYTEFVEFAKKQYLTSQEFLSGFALMQSLPGPTFSFSSYIGALSMRHLGIGGQLFGSAMASLGIFLPGAFLLFFMLRVWERLKNFRLFKASLEGIHAVSAGFVLGAAILLFQPLEHVWVNYVVVAISFTLLAYTKIPTWAIMLAGIGCGLLC